MKQCGVLDIKSKIKSIKLSIMWNLLISMILAVIITFFIFIFIFVMIHLISQETYEKLLKFCYSDTIAMIVTSFVILLVYLGCTITVFTYRLNEITDYIRKISNNIHKLAQGDFSEKLAIESNNELGCLAEDINIMSDKIEGYIKSEKKWNEERYNIITNMSHDLKTPIMSIDGFVQLIKNKKYANEKECDEYCEIISKKSKELSKAINQLLELSKLNEDGVQLEKSTLGLKEFVEQIMVSYFPLLEKRKMDFQISIEPDVSVTVDPVLMKRVFENIISNAIKYASSGRYLNIIAEQQGSQVTIHFINHGPMIPKHEIEHIYDRFYREKKNLENEGNGLGLAIAKAIMRLHDGTISVTSNEEETDFSIVLDGNIRNGNTMS